MRLLYGHDQDVAAFIAKLIPRCENGFGNCRAIGVINEDGLLVGGMAYHDWEPVCGVMEMSGASVTPRWATRETIRGIFSYPFLTAGCQMAVCRASVRNRRLAGLLSGIGFDRIDIPRLFGRHEDGVVWTLTREQWEASKYWRSGDERLAPASQGNVGGYH